VKLEKQHFRKKHIHLQTVETKKTLMTKNEHSPKTMKLYPVIIRGFYTTSHEVYPSTESLRVH
jgi:hypothetical protein